MFKRLRKQLSPLGWVDAGVFIMCAALQLFGTISPPVLTVGLAWLAGRHWRMEP